MAARIPIRIFPFKPSDTNPTMDGPVEQPMSPAKANSANIAVPPAGSATDALLSVPGHIMPTEKPQISHPSKLTTGQGESDIIR